MEQVYDWKVRNQEELTKFKIIKKLSSIKRFTWTQVVNDMPNIRAHIQYFQ